MTSAFRVVSAQGVAGGIPHQSAALAASFTELSFTELSASPLELLRAREAPPCNKSRCDKGNRRASKGIAAGRARMINGKRQQL